MAGNALVNVFRIRDLRQRILFTVGLLVVFRIGVALTMPGIDVNALKSYFSTPDSSGAMGFQEYLDFFSGGAFKQFSIFMLSIMPYITTSIIMNLLVMIIPRLKRIQEEEGGRKKIQRLTRYGTVLMCLIQSAVVTSYASKIPDAITVPMGLFIPVAMLTVTTGTVFLMWMGEQITQRGIGNGISLIIFAGIVARMPSAVSQLIDEVNQGAQNAAVVLVVFVLYVVVIALVIYEQQGQRKIPVNYAKRVVGRKMYGAQNTYIPFKINPSGVIPVIFASAILSFPMQIASQLGWDGLSEFLNPMGVAYQIIYVVLIIAFAYFYTQVTLNPVEIAKQIRENGGSIPGIRTEKIESHLTRILNRIVLPGSIFLALIAVIPSILSAMFKFPPAIAQLMGGTSLIIMVGVDLDTISQIEGHLRMHHQEGFTKKGKIRSRSL